MPDKLYTNTVDPWLVGFGSACLIYPPVYRRLRLVSKTGFQHAKYCTISQLERFVFFTIIPKIHRRNLLAFYND